VKSVSKSLFLSGFRLPAAVYSASMVETVKMQIATNQMVIP
jgi:hypothetical protein